jgi:hypothetical protein
VLTLELEPAEPEVLPALFNATIVCESIWPEAVRPFDCWNCFSAALVFGPSLPSTGPELKPASFSACCAWLTFELSCVDALVCEEALAWEAAGDV